MEDNKIVKTKLAIIGAGMSAISASVHLLDNNYDDFLIFEANDRIGGRIHTFNSENGFVELGAQSIHGQENNPVYYLARDFKLIDKEYFDIIEPADGGRDAINLNFYKDGDDFYQTFRDQTGRELDKSLCIQLNKIIDNIFIDSVSSVKSLNRYEAPISFGDYLIEEYENRVINNEEFKDINKKDLYGILEWRAKLESQFSSSHSVLDLSMDNLANYVDLKGFKYIQLIYGYKSIFDHMIAKHEQKFYSRLHLNHKLDKVKIENVQADADTDAEADAVNIPNILLSFSNGLKVECEKVLLTMSLGYLKENIRHLIEPLSCVGEEKLDTIDCHGFGTVNKIYLVYDKLFWDDKLQGINLIRQIDSKQHLYDKLRFKFNVEEEWQESISEFERVNARENMIVAWVGGSSYHEKLSDEQVKKGCTELLSKYLNRNDIPEPVEIIRSKWNTNPLFNGSYSYYSKNSKKNSNELLAEPISVKNNDLILFAGEATHSEYFSTVHGAYLSGIREAKRILKK